MAALSDYAEAEVAKWVGGITRPPAVTTRYLALYTAAPNDAGGGTPVSGGSYARQAVTMVAGGSAGEIENSVAVTFPNMPEADVTHAAIFDAVTSGNMLCHGALTSPKSVTAGASAVFEAGDVTFVVT